MKELTIYIPSETPTDITSTAYVRQNPWEKIYDVIDCDRISGCLQIPFTHFKETVDAFEKDRTTFLTTIPEKHRSQVSSCMSFPLDKIIIIPNGKKGLLVRIKSEVKAGVLNTLYIACSVRNCSHRQLRHGTFCESCHNSVVYIGDSTNIPTFQSKLSEGLLIEPFYTLFYEVDIIGEADYTSVDGRTIGGMRSVGERTRYWKVRV
jgi:hypothetical protein